MASSIEYNLSLIASVLTFREEDSIYFRSYHMLSNLSRGYIFQTVSALNNLLYEYGHIEDP